MSADLHLHTNESDGTWTPRQVVSEAVRRSLTIIAITDHDTTAGIEEAKGSAPDSLQVIPGIELSTISSGGEEVHIVGLWIDPSFPRLQSQLAVLRRARLERTKEIIKRLQDLGISITEDDVLIYAKKDVLSRSHIASALIAAGTVQTKLEAFQRFLAQGAPAYVERYKLAPQSAIELILAAGGVPILAHPGLLRDLEIIPRLAEAGLAGLEVIHSSHSAAQAHYFLELAEKMNLLPSGGSDCHGPGGKAQVFMGKYNIPASWAAELAAKRRR